MGNLPKWLKEELEKHPVHQTTSSKSEFICPSSLPQEVDILGTALCTQFSFCPFCGEELGEATEIDDGYKLIWEH